MEPEHRGRLGDSVEGVGEMAHISTDRTRGAELGHCVSPISTAMIKQLTERSLRRTCLFELTVSSYSP